MLLVCLHFVAAAHPQANYERLHKKAVVIDTHNDVLSSSVLDGKDIAKRLSSGHSDLPRWKEGGVDVQFFSVFTGPNARNKEGHFKDANSATCCVRAVGAVGG